MVARGNQTFLANILIKFGGAPPDTRRCTTSLGGAPPALAVHRQHLGGAPPIYGGAPPVGFGY